MEGDEVMLINLESPRASSGGTPLYTNDIPSTPRAGVNRSIESIQERIHQFSCAAHGEAPKRTSARIHKLKLPLDSTQHHSSTSQQSDFVFADMGERNIPNQPIFSIQKLPKSVTEVPGTSSSAVDLRSFPVTPERHKIPDGLAQLRTMPASIIVLDQDAQDEDESAECEEVLSIRRASPVALTRHEVGTAGVNIWPVNINHKEQPTNGDDPPGRIEVSSTENTPTKGKKTPWLPFERYKSRKSTSYPDYGPPTPLPQEEDHSRTPLGNHHLREELLQLQGVKRAMPKRSYGSMQPMNTLQSTQNTGTVASRPAKVFDLQNNLYQPDAVPKRQKTSHENQGMDPSQLSFSSPTTRSIQSLLSPSQRDKSQTPKADARVAEFRSTQGLVMNSSTSDRLKRRRGRQHNTLATRSNQSAGSHNRPPSSMVNGKTVVRLEDPNDLIDDHQQDSISDSLRPTYSSNARESYKGNANLVSVRDRPVESGMEFSKYFRVDNDELSEGQNGSRSGNAVRLKGSSLRKAKESKSHPASRRASQEEDELAKPGETLRSAKQAGLVIIKDDGQDDDADPTDKNDIPPTFSKAKKSRERVELSSKRYDVVQFLSQRDIFLLKTDNNPWSLHWTEGQLIFTPVEGTRGAELPLQETAFHTVCWAEDSRIRIGKSQNQELSGSSYFYFELKTPEQARDVVKHIHSLQNVKLDLINQEEMEKIFKQARESIRAFNNKKSQREVGGDIAFLTEKARQPAAIAIKNALSQKQHQPKEKIKDRLQFESQPSNSNPPKDSGSLLERTFISSSDFYGNRVTPTNIRPSTRSQRSMLQRVQSPPLRRLLSRSPSPPRWTDDHPEWSRNWSGSIIYPPVGKNKATVDKADISRLDEGQFLNDNLVMFYLHWLEHELSRSPDIARRVYFFNSYFYERLTSKKGRKNGINYEAVERWTAKVDLLSYDFIIVPINENAHWYVAIICNVPSLLHFSAKEATVNGVPSVEDSRTETVSTSSSRVSPPGKELQQMSLEEIETDTIEGHSESQLGESQDRLASVKTAAQADNKNGTSRNVPEPAIEIAKGHLDHSTDSLEKSRPAKESLLHITRSSAIPLNNVEHGEHLPTNVRRKYGIAGPFPPGKEPKIITLDSLGNGHSPVCTNLKNYIIAEAKSKRNIDLPNPGALGSTMTVPQQSNHCDCGLFLLGYIQKFLKDPDDFFRRAISASFPKSHELDKDGKRYWPEWSTMRAHIRELLFKVQAEQSASKSMHRKTISKTRKTPVKAENGDMAAITSKSQVRPSTEMQPGMPCPSPFDGANDEDANEHRQHTDLPEQSPSLKRKRLPTPGSPKVSELHASAMLDTRRQQLNRSNLLSDASPKPDTDNQSQPLEELKVGNPEQTTVNTEPSIEIELAGDAVEHQLKTQKIAQEVQQRLKIVQKDGQSHFEHVPEIPDSQLQRASPGRIELSTEGQFEDDKEMLLRSSDIPQPVPRWSPDSPASKESSLPMVPMKRGLRSPPVRGGSISIDSRRSRGTSRRIQTSRNIHSVATEDHSELEFLRETRISPRSAAR